mmetsp:Transcript_20759/g.25179  ORF Transcript_20759/g.25179 Transcript_20759/m.25179 type:complete len:100 (+) Transcript_20759:412-711(+)
MANTLGTEFNLKLETLLTIVKKWTYERISKAKSHLFNSSTENRNEFLKHLQLTSQFIFGKTTDRKCLFTMRCLQTKWERYVKAPNPLYDVSYVEIIVSD